VTIDRGYIYGLAAARTVRIPDLKLHGCPFPIINPTGPPKVPSHDPRDSRRVIVKITLAIWLPRLHVHVITGTVIGPPTTERGKRSRPKRRSAVQNSDDASFNHALECFRLAAECRNLAGDDSTPEHMRAHFLSMADMWTDLAVPTPDEC
jgi:hypothetical protein